MKIILVMKIILAFLFVTLSLTAQTFIVKTGSYVGDGSDDRLIEVSGVNPTSADKNAWVSIMSQSNNAGCFKTTAHSGEASSYYYNFADAATNMIQSFAENGFVIGTNASVNSLGVNYDWFLVVGDTSIFTCESYTGNGIGGRDVMSKDISPALAIVNAASGQFSAWKTTDESFPADSCLLACGYYSLGTDLLNMSSGTVTVGSGARVNGNGVTYSLIAIEGGDWFEASSYVGNGVAGKTVEFQSTKTEDYMIVVGPPSSDASTMVKTSSMDNGRTNFVGNFSAVTTFIPTLTTTSYSVGTHDWVNRAGRTYRWFALSTYEPEQAKKSKYRGFNERNKY